MPEHTSDAEGDLLRHLTQILTEIKTTPSTGEISADLLGQLRLLMLQIEDLAADETNTEARQLKEQSDAYLSLWFDDLVAQCEAEGDELDWDADGYDDDADDNDEMSLGDDDDDEDDDDDDVALALALQDEEDAVQDDIHDTSTATLVTVDAPDDDDQMIESQHHRKSSTNEIVA